MTEHTPSFDLLEREWIPVRWKDGTAGEVSIRTALGSAAEIRDIGGELPTQTFAITRLLLAILYRVADDRLDVVLWRRWWERGIPLDEVDEYLRDYADRFDLLHPDRPFFQVADLTTAKGDVKDVAPLILDLPSKRLFTNRAGVGAERLSFAEAARWVVNAQAFDPSGIKSGAVGDPRVNGGKGYPIGLAWSGLLGGIVQEGDDLRETLLLNLVGGGKYFTVDVERDVPPWEDTGADTSAERENLRPHGPVRLFTWQSRRIRLVHDGEAVTGSLIANGDALTPQDRFDNEPMTAWRYSDPQSKKFKRTTYMPREHRPERAFWRGIGPILPATSNVQKGVTQSLAPATAEWVSTLQNLGILEPGKRIRLRAIGVVYGSNNSVVDDIIDDRLTVALTLLREDNEALAQTAEAAVRLADEGIWALRRLAENLAKAAGGEGEGDRQRAEEAAYARLDGEYRRWLAGLDGTTDPVTALSTWRTTARRVLRELGDDLVGAAGPSAWAGREISGLTGPDLINTPRADGWFRTALTKTFGKDADA